MKNAIIVDTLKRNKTLFSSARFLCENLIIKQDG